MNRDFQLPSIFLIYAICLPVAILLGYMLGGGGFFNYALVGLFVFTLCLPLFVQWYHWILIFALNSSLLVFFVPGRPELGAVMAAFGLGVAILTRTVSRESPFIWVRPVCASLIFLLIVIIVTAYFTGGIGGRVFGSAQWGAKRYLGVFGAIFGFFALISKKVPKDKAMLAAGIFFLAGLTSIISNIAYSLGPSFYFLFQFFPTDLASHQYRAQGDLVRLTGVGFAAMDAVFFMMLYYGIRGILDLQRPWRLVVTLTLLGISLLGGYRSVVVLTAIVFVIQFYYEGLHRTKILPALGGVGLLAAIFTILFLDKMPLAVQRSLSFLPVQVDKVAAQDAQSTLTWRLEMWQLVLPQVPENLLFGEGYTFDGVDYYLTQKGIERGIYPAYEHTLISGNYHQGILTIIIPFGIWGLIGFLWFSAAGWWVLYRNFYYGDPQLLRINTFLLAYFSGRWVFYTFLYGQFDLEFVQMTAAVGLSIAINHGVCGPRDREIEAAEAEGAEVQQARLQPATA